MRNTYTERLKEKLKEALQAVLIVVPTAQKNQIMKAIMEQADASYTCLVLNNALVGLGMANYQYVPTTLFVDRNGNIIGSEVVGANNEAGWREEIAARLEMIKE